MSSTAQRNPSRTPEEWDELARSEIVPALQAGAKMGEMNAKYGNTTTIRRALGRIGYDTKGREVSLKEITASRPATLAKKVADERSNGTSWWKLEVSTGKSQAELKALLAEHGHEDVSHGRISAPVE